jgi:thiamine biosynthesis lipoprotein
MGTVFELYLAGAPAEYLRDAGHQALEQLHDLEARLSPYRQDSDLADLNLRAPHGPVCVEPWLFGLLQRCADFCRESDGAFDIACGALISCWKLSGPEAVAATQAGAPPADVLAAALAATGSHLLELEPGARTVRFLHPRLRLHPGAVGKGCAVDRIVEVLRELRVPAALVHGGGSTVYGLGAPPGGPAWPVGLQHPQRRGRLGVALLRDRALSTSAGTEQYREHAGRRYGHLLDPRTGYPVPAHRSATIFAQTATEADALSTAACVLGASAAARVLGAAPEAGLVLIPAPEDLPNAPRAGGPGAPQPLVVGKVSLQQGE